MAKRRRYTEAQRAEILSAARSEGLTAKEVQKKYGVTPVTYYSWRKKSGAPPARRGRRPGTAAAAGGGIEAQVRAGVQARVRQILPEIVREEVGSYLEGLFGSAPRRRGRRPGRPRKKK